MSVVLPWWLIAYVAGVFLIVVLTRLVLRSEPMAHGQIVGTQIGCLVALFWPVALPIIIIASAAALIRGIGSRFK